MKFNFIEGHSQEFNLILKYTTWENFNEVELKLNLYKIGSELMRLPQGPRLKVLVI